MSGAGEQAPEAGAGQSGDRPAPEPPGGALSVDVPGLLAQLARSFALLLPVYALGYLGLSFSWVLLALGLLAWCRRSRGLKASRLCRALALLEDEERVVRLGVRACDLPAWVSADRPGPAEPGPQPRAPVRARGRFLPLPRARRDPPGRVGRPGPMAGPRRHRVPGRGLRRWQARRVGPQAARSSGAEFPFLGFEKCDSQWEENLKFSSIHKTVVLGSF